MDWRSRRFERAAGTYERVTPVQSSMARRLAGLVPGDAPYGSVLELGCGTGHLTRELLRANPESRFVVTDFAPGMLACCAEHLGDIDRERVEFRVLDAREPVIAEAFDLIASSAMVQWFPDLSRHLAGCARILPPGGLYALSGFCRSNFPELDALLSGPPWNFPDPPGHFLSEAIAAARSVGFEIQLSEEDVVEYTYPSAMEFLRAIGQAGASRAPRDGRPMTRALLTELIETYGDRYPAAGGVRATWKPWFLLLRKHA